MSLIHVTAIHVNYYQFPAVINVQYYLIEVTIVFALINLLYPSSGLLAAQTWSLHNHCFINMDGSIFYSINTNWVLIARHSLRFW